MLRVSGYVFRVKHATHNIYFFNFQIAVGWSLGVGLLLATRNLQPESFFLRNFNCIQNFSNNFFGSDVVCFGFVA